MKLKLLICLSLFSTILNAQWRVTTPAGTTIDDITFTDRYHGYAVFQSSGIGNCTVSHGLYKTINEGKDWVRMNTGNTSVINAVHFVNQLTGWFTGSSSDIRKTTDGGATWVQQSSGVGSGNNDIWFKDVNNGFVIGNNGILRKTTNGGSTWQTIASGVTVALRRIFFANNNLGFIACGNGQILRTTDGGNTWSVITTGAGSINDIFFVDANTGYLSSSNNLFKSVDGGLTWNSVITGASYPILRIFFTDLNTGFLSVSGEGIYKTTNAGLTWHNNTTLNGLYDTFYAIYFTDVNTGYIGGDLGKINKTVDGGLTWKNMITGLGTELFTVFATNKDTAYIGGKEGKIFKTENGGVSYFQQTKAFPSIINKLYFINNNIGFACSDSGRMMKTTDGGEHWILKTTNTLRGFTDISFINDNIGFASASGGFVFKTNDAGETWDSISTGEPDAYRAIWFLNEDTGFIAGSNKIVSTYNGGLTWSEHTSAVASSLQDIIFTNDSLGYCAGTFGKILFTIDGGLTWNQTNNTIVGAAIEEMWFANDSVGYFAKSTTQYITLDSCKTVGTIPTACLANNWTMNSISMTDGGTYGYCVGGLNGIIHQTEQREIYRTYTSTNTYCAGSNIFIAYYARGFYGVTNTFTAQLSDASGSFANPVNIGTYTATPSAYQSGIITATIPFGTVSGSNYRVRVIASDPATIGVYNGNDITIQSSFTPSVTLNSSANGTICAGSMLSLSASPFAGGLNPIYTWTINGNIINNNSNLLVINSLQDGDIVQVSMISNLNCANTLPVLSNTFTASILVVLPLTLANDTTVCANSSLQLNAPAGYNYIWSPSQGLNNPTIANPTATISNNITYFLTITDATGCAGTDSITINSNPLPQISFASDTSVCENACVTLLPIVGGNLQISWSPASTLNDSTVINPTACPTINISYTATVTDSNQCTASSNINVDIYPTPNTPTVSFDGTSLTSTSASTYQWYEGGNIIAGATNISYVPLMNGDYTVEVTDASGCIAMSNPFVVNINGLTHQTNSTGVLISPNPVLDVLHITLNTNENFARIIIFNAAGEIIYKNKTILNNTLDVDTKTFSAGVYIVSVQSISGVYHQRVSVLK
ncbi:MAG: T9SS type A sorting domain-containing protein [Bacteroidia bacterium]|nr:T9SS type A sorting domain-containing protein [Bacteroidia bacterium]MCZ2247214.1 T9SS type A sorting domain-containing protein [Bacteroidia bacterium]